VILKICLDWFTHHSLNLNQVLREGMSKVRSRFGSFGLHVQFRGGSWSELSCLRSEDVLSIASIITNKLTNSGVCCIHVFFMSNCVEICLEVGLSLS
jgi:hypothetical protein